jgi:hypothetical protein
MRHFRPVLLGLLLIGGWIPQAVLSKTVTLVNSSGESVEIEVQATDQFLEVLDRIQSYFQADALAKRGIEEFEETEPASEGTFLNHSQLDFFVSHAGVTIRSKKTNWRDYETSVTKSEKKDIAYIVTTLAYDSLLSIGTSASSLKETKKRIIHIHPFRFLMTVFTDEKLKAGIHAIRDRGGWIWSGFIDGLEGSLNEEAGRKNLLQFAPDFAKKVHINVELIMPSLQQGKWGDFVNILIDKIPREIDPNRYDM